MFLVDTVLHSAYGNFKLAISVDLKSKIQPNKHANKNINQNFSKKLPQV